MEEAAKTAKESAETVSKGGGKLGKTGAFRALSQVARNAVYVIDCELSGVFLRVCCERSRFLYLSHDKLYRV